MKFAFVAAAALSLLLTPLVSHAAPQILFSGTNVFELNLNDNVVNFTVVATDSLGADALAGAVLTDVESGATYGGFSANAKKGTYTFSLTLSEIKRVRPVDPTPVTGEVRLFRAQVFNSTGQSTAVDLPVTLKRRESYEALPADFLKTLPAEIANYAKKRSYIQQTELEMNQELAVYFNTGKNTTYIEDRNSSKIIAKRAGRSLFDEMTATVKAAAFNCGSYQDGSGTTAQEVIVCSSGRFNFRCVEKAGKALGCWKDVNRY